MKIDILKESILKVKKESFFSMLFVALECLFEIFVPYMMSKLIDNGIEKGDVASIARYGFIIFLVIICQVAGGVLCARFAILASTKFATDLRERMFRKLQEFTFANIDKFSTGSLVTRLTTDVVNVQRAFQMVIRGAIRSIGMIIFSLVVSYTINVKIALIFTSLMPIIVGGFILLSKVAYPLFQKMFEAFDNLNNVISENIHGIRVVKTFNREDFEYKKVVREADKIYDYSIKAETLLAIVDPFINVTMYAVFISIAWFGSKAILMSGNNPLIGLTTGKLMSLMTYGMQVLMSLVMISVIYVMIVISSSSLERIEEVLNETIDMGNVENPIYDIKDGAIEFKHVSFKFRPNADKNVLSDIDLKINSGEMIGVIGGTGSGKSSLVNLIPRLFDVTEGELLVSGVNVKNYDLISLRKAVGIVLQKNVLFSGTIASNLRFGNESATLEEMEKACDIAGAMEFINEKPLKFDEPVEQGGTNFSGGQKQRLSIARTILKKPKILIFDDSTSAVDTKTDARIRKALKEHMKSATKIIISQRIISLIDCDKIIVLDDGKVVAFDTHDNLVKNCEIYRDINTLQNDK